MSRIGKKPIALPAGVTATVESGTLTVKGPKGQLAMQLLDDLVKYEIAEGEIRVTPITDAQRNRAAWGMQRTNVQNLVTGVTEGFTKVLEITGVGYRAAAQG
jgi:large subunit ribosomal protein L6